MSYFKYNNVTSDSMGVTVSRYPDYSIPQRVVTKFNVPGRNGDLIIDSGSYTNVKREYEIYLNAKATGFHTAAHNIANWLCRSGNYLRLEDSYDPDIYMMARVDNPSEIANWMNYMGRANVIFDCKPQRFIKTGETEITVTDGQEIQNAYMPAKPLINVKLPADAVTTHVEFDIAGGINYLMEVVNPYSGESITVTIDLETQDAWTTRNYQRVNMNPYVSVEATGWPVLGGFVSTFIEHDATTMTMVPRFWTL